jgi:hypothetical protein
MAMSVSGTRHSLMTPAPISPPRRLAQGMLR